MIWVLVLIVGGGYAAHSVSGFSSKLTCEAAYEQILDSQRVKAAERGYAVHDIQRFSVSGHYCVRVE